MKYIHTVELLLAHVHGEQSMGEQVVFQQTNVKKVFYPSLN